MLELLHISIIKFTIERSEGKKREDGIELQKK